MSIINLTPTQLRQAADLKEKIAALEKQLGQLQGTKASVAKPAAKKKGGMSAAGKAKIAAAQKLRWAKINAAKGKTAAPKAAAKPVKKARKKMSAAAKAKISAAAKARWAKVKGTAKPAAAPKVAAKPAAKKKISAEGIARIKAAQKARWAKINAAKAAKK